MDDSDLLLHDKPREILQGLARQDEETLLEVFRYKVSKYNNLPCDSTASKI